MKNAQRGASPCWHAFCVAHFSQSRLTPRRTRKKSSALARLDHRQPISCIAIRPRRARRRTTRSIGMNTCSRAVPTQRLSTVPWLSSGARDHHTRPASPAAVADQLWTSDFPREFVDLPFPGASKSVILMDNDGKVVPRGSGSARGSADSLGSSAVSEVHVAKRGIAFGPAGRV